MRVSHLFPLFLAGVLFGCKKEPEPARGSPFVHPGPAVSAPKLAAPAAPTGMAEAHPVAVTWEDPAGWTRVQGSSPVRKATYRPPRAAGDKDDSELAVFYFGPGQGGGIEANVDRWIKQFQGVKPESVRREDRSANGLRQHTVEIDKGPFASGMPGANTEPRPDFGLLGAIVEAPSGAYFFKLTGPSASVKAARPAFLKLLDSVKPAG